VEGTCKIHLRQNYEPSVYPARKFPQSLKQKLRKEPDRLVQTGELVKAERPTDWVLPLVVVEKPNGDLRLCLDPMDLNEYIRREHYHLQQRSEIIGEMADARYFTKMDASQGFYQIQLDEESTQLCTVTTTFGRYSFKRLPYGINFTVHQKYSTPRFSNCSHARQESKSTWMTQSSEQEKSTTLD